jgi:hypothetical protein
MDSIDTAQGSQRAQMKLPAQTPPVERSRHQAAQLQSVVQSGCCVPRIFGFCPLESPLCPF